LSPVPWNLVGRKKRVEKQNVIKINNNSFFFVPSARHLTTLLSVIDTRTIDRRGGQFESFPVIKNVTVGKNELKTLVTITHDWLNAS